MGNDCTSELHSAQDLDICTRTILHVTSSRHTSQRMAFQRPYPSEEKSRNQCGGHWKDTFADPQMQGLMEAVGHQYPELAENVLDVPGDQDAAAEHDLTMAVCAAAVISLKPPRGEDDESYHSSESESSESDDEEKEEEDEEEKTWLYDDIDVPYEAIFARSTEEGLIFYRYSAGW